MLEPLEAALEAFREAVRLGFPVYAKKLVGDALLLRSPEGKAVVFVLERRSGGAVEVLVGPDRYSIWSRRVAVIKSDGAVEVYPEEAVEAAGQNPLLISTFEADVWRRRIRLLRGGKAVEKRLEEAPPELRRIAGEQGGGCRLLYLEETLDYALLCGGAVVAWYNAITRRLDDAREWQARMGVSPQEA